MTCARAPYADVIEGDDVLRSPSPSEFCLSMIFSENPGSTPDQIRARFSGSCLDAGIEERLQAQRRRVGKPQHHAFARRCRQPMLRCLALYGGAERIRDD